jgi:hypothetical protein
LAEFIWFQQAYSSIGHTLNIDNKGLDIMEHKWCPKEISIYLYDLLDWIWQQIQEPIDWSNKEKLEKQLYKHDRLFIELYRDHFQNILEKMICEFYWKNLYKEETSYHIKNVNTKNKNRRLELEEYAKKILWDDRIIFSWMNDWESNIIHNILHSNKINNNNNVEQKYKLFWNSTDYIDILSDSIALRRYNILKKCFFEAVEEKWYQITTNTTHLLWGEYYNRCVGSYWYLLKLYWVPQEKISSIQDISLSFESLEDKIFRKTSENINSFVKS